MDLNKAVEKTLDEKTIKKNRFSPSGGFLCLSFPCHCFALVLVNCWGALLTFLCLVLHVVVTVAQVFLL